MRTMNDPQQASLIMTLLMNRPIIGVFVAIATFFTGVRLPQMLLELHIPPIIMESLQALAFCGTIIVATLTTIAWIKKHLRK